MNGSKAFNIAMVLSSLAFTFFWLPLPPLFDVACIILIFFFIQAVISPINNERNDALIRLAVLFLLYTIISIIWHRLTLPDNFPPTTSDRRFLRVLYFIPIAYAVSRSRLLTAWQLLAVAFSGLLVYLAASFNQAEWIRAWQGQRVDFGIHNAQHTGIVFATSTLGFSFFTPRFFSWIRNKPPAAAWFSALFWIAALLFSLWGVFVSQTRAVWLGLSVTLLLFPGILLFAHCLSEKLRLSLRKTVLSSVAGVLLIGLLAAGFNLPSLVADRLSAEKVSWESLRLAASHEEQVLTSIGVRVSSWSAAIDWIKERPLMGWGGRGSRPLIQQSEIFSDSFKETFNHLHNSYFQVLVEIGLIGAAFIAALTVLIGRKCIISYRQKSMPLDVFLFSWAFFLFWLVSNFFESYIIYSSGTYLVAIVVGFFYSFCIKQVEQPTERTKITI